MTKTVRPRMFDSAEFSLGRMFYFLPMSFFTCFVVACLSVHMVTGTIPHAFPYAMVSVITFFTIINFFKARND